MVAWRDFWFIVRVVDARLPVVVLYRSSITGAAGPFRDVARSVAWFYCWEAPLSLMKIAAACLATACCAGVTSAGAATCGNDSSGFGRWVTEIRGEAVAAGISARAVDQVLSQVS